MIWDSFIIMILGMGTTFIFLGILVVMMFFLKDTMTFLNKFMPEPVAAAPKKRTVTVSDDSAVAAAIALAYKTSGRIK